jgi:thiamine-monophosphate kinase
MDEFELIDRFFANQRVNRADVKLGIGDDAAVTSIDPGFDLVVATDSIFEGTHFPVGTTPHALGYRCLAVNLSDLAAMGAEPTWCTLALSLPSADPEWMDAFASGFFSLAERFNVALVGGDTVRGPLAMTVTVHGRVPAGRHVSRSGAGAGESIYLTGYCGEAGAGLRVLTGLAVNNVQAGDRLIRRFLYPEPRVAEGRIIADFASAMIDISDGLHEDIQKLMQSSGMGAELETGDVPVSQDLLACVSPQKAIELALTGGDDYELCFTVSPDKEAELRSLLATAGGRMTRIGQTRSEAGVCWMSHGERYAVAGDSFQHF